MRKDRYTKEVLEPLIKKNISIAGVMRDLGIKVLNGGTHTHISKRVKSFGFDASHFLGSRANQGLGHLPKKKSAEETLIYKTDSNKQHVDRLRRALIEIGVKECCSSCGLGTFYNGKFLRIQINHINGNTLDNRRENLEFVCPNCHSQTDNFGIKNAKLNKGQVMKR